MLVRFAAVAVAMMYSPVISGAQDTEIPPVICSECPEGEEGGIVPTGDRANPYPHNSHVHAPGNES
jgi:hypothetical protein